MKEYAADALEAWDAGESVFTIEMGGLGPGYEQALQVLMFEFLRELLNGWPRGYDPFEDRSPAHPDEQGPNREAVFAIALEVEAEGENLGFSGAQVIAAWYLAYRASWNGWAATIREQPESRRIQVSRTWPRLEREDES